MSDEPKDLYYHYLFQDNQHLESGTSSYNEKMPPYNNYSQGSNDFSNYMSFNDQFLQRPVVYNSMASAFGLPASSSQVFASVESNLKPMEVGDLGGGSGTNVLVTANSSMSSSSTEAGAKEYSDKSSKDRQPKELEDGGDDPESSKKV